MCFRLTPARGVLQSRIQRNQSSTSQPSSFKRRAGDHGGRRDGMAIRLGSVRQRWRSNGLSRPHSRTDTARDARLADIQKPNGLATSKTTNALAGWWHGRRWARTATRPAFGRGGCQAARRGRSSTGHHRGPAECHTSGSACGHCGCRANSGGRGSISNGGQTGHGKRTS